MLVPSFYHTLICLSLTHHEDWHTAHLTVLIYYIILFEGFPDCLYFLLCKFGRSVQHIAESLLHKLDVLSVLFRQFSQFYIRFPE